VKCGDLCPSSDSPVQRSQRNNVTVQGLTPFYYFI